MMKCPHCGYDYSNSGDSAHLCNGSNSGYGIGVAKSSFTNFEPTPEVLAERFMSDPDNARAMDELYEKRWAHRFD